ncbi:MAG: hypothetical protein HY093_03160 [Candidatus Liptonbacteria bacterium]|nr:hypothetical protein [Candidatus Liptonbacteria bacterium]
MNNNFKKIFTRLLVVIGVILVGFYLSRNANLYTNPNDGNKKTQREKIILSITEKKGEGFNKYKLTSKGDENVIVIPYKEKFNLQEWYGGIMVIQNYQSGSPRVLWEIKSEAFKDIPQKLEVRDINNDGNNEILSWWSAGARLDANILWIFTWTGNNFTDMTPLIYQDKKVKDEDANIPKFYESIFSGREVDVKDLNSDGVNEILVTNLIPTKVDSSQPYTSSILESMKIVKIYKWNGHEYYLWKEEKLKPNDPNP